MRLRETLLHVAVLLSSGTYGCGSTAGETARDGGASPDADATFDAGGSADAGEDAGSGCGGCCTVTPSTTASATPAQACAIAQQVSTSPFAGACAALCGDDHYCTLPADYQSAFNASADAGLDAGGADASAPCPAWVNDVVVECGLVCLGRRTDGIADPVACGEVNLGSIFAERAYLEEVSVHAFARLERELEDHGAPVSLLAHARRARRDEIRHTATMARLARRYGASPRSPAPARPTPPRPLLAVAIENAVEGCVRETYGAVVGLLEARSSADPHVRRAMDRVARDECRHAELALRIARWIEPRLTSDERREVARATRDAVHALAADGDRSVVAMIERHVWSRQDAFAIS